MTRAAFKKQHEKNLKAFEKRARERMRACGKPTRLFQWKTHLVVAGMKEPPRPCTRTDEHWLCWSTVETLPPNMGIIEEYFERGLLR